MFLLVRSRCFSNSSLASSRAMAPRRSTHHILCFPYGTHACALDRSDSLNVFVPLELENQEMVPPGLEPGTLRLLAVRSNQLSYETADIDHFSFLVRINFFDLLVPSDSFTLLNSLARHRETHSLKKKVPKKIQSFVRTCFACSPAGNCQQRHSCELDGAIRASTLPEIGCKHDGSTQLKQSRPFNRGSCLPRAARLLAHFKSHCVLGA